MSEMQPIAKALTFLFAMVISLTFHEFAHALVAKMQGDKTAESQGRLTLNPLAHIDMMGTIVLPLMGIYYNAPILGWAKPVPIDPRNFRDSKFGPLMVALAGPISNLLLSFLCTLVAFAHEVHGQLLIPQDSFFYPMILLCYVMIYLNAGLAFFNLIPFPPLDGSAILDLFLPRSLRPFYENYIVPYGFIILLFLMMASGLSWIGDMARGYAKLMQIVAGALIT